MNQFFCVFLSMISNCSKQEDIDSFLCILSFIV